MLVLLPVFPVIIYQPYPPYPLSCVVLFLACTSECAITCINILFTLLVHANLTLEFTSVACTTLRQHYDGRPASSYSRARSFSWLIFWDCTSGYSGSSFGGHGAKFSFICLVGSPWRRIYSGRTRIKLQELHILYEAGCKNIYIVNTFSYVKIQRSWRICHISWDQNVSSPIILKMIGRNGQTDRLKEWIQLRSCCILCACDQNKPFFTTDFWCKLVFQSRSTTLARECRLIMADLPSRRHSSMPGNADYVYARYTSLTCYLGGSRVSDLQLFFVYSSNYCAGIHWQAVPAIASVNTETCMHHANPQCLAWV